jgi:hypothetical protein
MPLAAGSRLGPFEIESALGAGGMGEVYRAHDTRLNRSVAVKVLPASVASDADRRLRFEREAQAVAALSHPNVLAIFDYGVDNGVAFAVTELLDGESLRDRLSAGPIPSRKAIDYAVQIARGLAAAHEKQLIHRDLKPENVFLLKDGQVKILDFGLARSIEAQGSGASETVAALTDPGTVMGTVGYMAPEQVRGGAIDPRTDLFAFGAVLYEMLIGIRAFRRETAAETMTAILREEPPQMTATRADIPGALDRIVHHCLEKNPAERFQTARDVAFALENLSGSGQAVATSSTIPAQSESRGPRRALALAGAAVALAAVTFVAGWLAAGREPQPRVTFNQVTWPQQTIFNARFMADDQGVVFSGAQEGNSASLFVIRAGTALQQKFGPPETHLLSVSRTGELAVLMNARFLSGRLFTGTLGRMTMDGSPRPVLENVREADWAADDSLAVVRFDEAKDYLEYPAGKVLVESGGYLSDPRVSPDGGRVAFMRHQGRFDDRGFLEVVDRDGKVTRLTGELIGAQGITWSPDGTTIFYSGTAVTEMVSVPYLPMAVPAAGGPSRPAWPSPGSMWIHDITSDGRVLATREEMGFGVGAKGAGETAERDLTWINYSFGAFLSKDGRRLLFTEPAGSSNYTLCARGVDGSPVLQIGEGHSLGFSPDGQWAAALLPASQELMLYPTGVGQPRKIARGPISEYDLSAAQWFPDSRHLLVVGNEAGKRGYYKQSIDGGAPQKLPALQELTTVVLEPAGASVLAKSRDGSWGRYDLSGKLLTPLKGMTTADAPAGWAGDGQTIFVRRQMGEAIRLNPVTGAVLNTFTAGPRARTGMTRLEVSHVLDDGRVYAYSYERRLSAAFVASGVR